MVRATFSRGSIDIDCLFSRSRRRRIDAIERTRSSSLSASLMVNFPVRRRCCSPRLATAGRRGSSVFSLRRAGVSSLVRAGSFRRGVAGPSVVSNGVKGISAMSGDASFLFASSSWRSASSKALFSASSFSRIASSAALTLASATAA